VGTNLETADNAAAATRRTNPVRKIKRPCSCGNQG
jgi:hypothetical protein